MRGRVIKYFQDKGYGFIKDETGNSRFFHITKVKELSEISEGSLVEFKPEETNKGLACIDIIVLNENKPIFIALGDVRSKLSNIKNYGLDRSDEHTSELQSRGHLVCCLLLEKKK